MDTSDGLLCVLLPGTGSGSVDFVKAVEAQLYKYTNYTCVCRD